MEDKFSIQDTLSCLSPKSPDSTESILPFAFQVDSFLETVGPAQVSQQKRRPKKGTGLTWSIAETKLYLNFIKTKKDLFSLSLK
jgi:hypothetical protein